jgi:hypothetical protein
MGPGTKAVARKKKSKPFSAVIAVKAAARAAVGPVPVTRRAPDTKKKAAKKAIRYKSTLQRLMQEKD